MYLSTSTSVLPFNDCSDPDTIRLIKVEVMREAELVSKFDSTLVKSEAPLS